MVSQIDIENSLRALGVRPGDVVCLHIALRSIGEIDGGPETVLNALLNVLGSNGTIAMAAHNPAGENPLVDEPFDVDMTSAKPMGALAELLRKTPGTRRSWHPRASWLAYGLSASEITAVQQLEDPFGEPSPFSKMEELDAKVLLVGVGYGMCTALHLAEVRSGTIQIDDPQNSRVWRNGKDEILSWLQRNYDSSDFESFTSAIDGQPFVNHGVLGQAVTRLIPMSNLVSYSAGLMTRTRSI